MRHTFERRSTPFPSDLPVGLSNDYVKTHQRDWKAFHNQAVLEYTTDLGDQCALIARFVVPLLRSAADKNAPFVQTWNGRDWIHPESELTASATNGADRQLPEPSIFVHR